MEIIKSLTENIDKICKYISFTILLFCIACGSFAIYFFDIKNTYLIIFIYASTLFFSIITKNVIKFFQTKYINYKMKSPRFLKKVWKNLSKDEQIILAKSYSNNYSIYGTLDDRIIILLMQKSIIMRPAQFSDVTSIKYIIQPWAEKMIDQNRNNIKKK